MSVSLKKSKVNVVVMTEESEAALGTIAELHGDVAELSHEILSVHRKIERMLDEIIEREFSTLDDEGEAFVKQVIGMRLRQHLVDQDVCSGFHARAVIGQLFELQLDQAIKRYGLERMIDDNMSHVR